MKKLVCLVFVILLCLPALAIVPETSYKTAFDFPRKYGVERVTNYDPRVNYGRINTFVYLTPPAPKEYVGAGRGGYAPFYPRATVQIGSTSWYGSPLINIVVKTKDLDPSYDKNMMYEVWLVDAETGYRLSVGTFTTGFGGVGELYYTMNNYADPYDFVEITSEPFEDFDVSPGPLVLVGGINARDRTPQPGYFNPEPKDTKMISSLFTNY